MDRNAVSGETDSWLFLSALLSKPDRDLSSFGAWCTEQMRCGGAIEGTGRDHSLYGDTRWLGWREFGEAESLQGPGREG